MRQRDRSSDRVPSRRRRGSSGPSVRRRRRSSSETLDAPNSRAVISAIRRNERSASPDAPAMARSISAPAAWRSSCRSQFGPQPGVLFPEIGLHVRGKRGHSRKSSTSGPGGGGSSRIRDIGLIIPSRGHLGQRQMHELRATRLTCPSACSSRYSQPMITRFRRCLAAESHLRASAGVLNASAFSRFLNDQSGATAIEYCLIACGIAFTIIARSRTSAPAQQQILVDQYVAEVTLRISSTLGRRTCVSAFAVPVQRPQHRDPREHQPAAAGLGRMDQILHRDLPALLLLGLVGSFMT